jgi:hypothetical protein
MAKNKKLNSPIFLELTNLIINNENYNDSACVPDVFATFRTRVLRDSDRYGCSDQSNSDPLNLASCYVPSTGDGASYMRTSEIQNISSFTDDDGSCRQVTSQIDLAYIKRHPPDDTLLPFYMYPAHSGVSAPVIVIFVIQQIHKNQLVLI